jgi:hypothetical protein
VSEKLLDGLARALAEPMPRRGAVRAIAGAVAALAFPAVAPRETHASTRPSLRRGPATARAQMCPDNGVCRDPGTVCCPTPSPASGQFNCCKTKAHCCCGNVCCDPQSQICICPVPGGVGGGCVDRVCGPNLTEALGEAVYAVKTEFARWSAPERAVLCSHLYTMGAIAWDIAELDPANRKAFIARYGPECTTCGNAVGVGYDCHFAGSVNYVVFGVMMRLCHDTFAGSPFASWFDQDAMNLMIVLHKTDLVTADESANLDPSSDWANAGYRGWPFKGPTPRGDRKQCKATCGKPYAGNGLTVRWSHKRIRLPR